MALMCGGVGSGFNWIHITEAWDPLAEKNGNACTKSCLCGHRGKLILVKTINCLYLNCFSSRGGGFMRFSLVKRFGFPQLSVSPHRCCSRDII